MGIDGVALAGALVNIELARILHSGHGKHKQAQGVNFNSDRRTQRSRVGTPVTNVTIKNHFSSSMSTNTVRTNGNSGHNIDVRG